MSIIGEYVLLYRVWFWVTLFLIGVYGLVLLWWQLKVLRGGRMENPDGSGDDWSEQPSHFGIALADVCLACPASFAAVILSIVAPRIGLYLLGAVGFWFIWANIMTTATSLRFHNPKLTFSWWVTFPPGIVLGISAFLLPLKTLVKAVG